MDSFEQNRLKILEDLKKSRKPSSKRPTSTKIKAVASAVANDAGPMRKIALLTKSGPLGKNMAGSLRSLGEVTVFSQAEELVNSHATAKYACVLLDLDPPTDYRIGHDAFSSIAMEDQNVPIVVVTVNRMASPVRMLEQKGAIIMGKPFSAALLRDNVFK